MFGRKPKASPTIRSDWFVLTFDQKDERWTLTYRDTDFCFTGAEVALPERALLDSYLGWIEANREHIDRQVRDMAVAHADVHVDPQKAHVASVDVESPNRIVVMVLGDETWGDIGYDLWIEDGVIVKEGFGD